MNKADRQGISNLHGVANGTGTNPANRRDASNSAMNGSGRWTQPPTPIPAPGASNRGSGMNPFAGGRLSDNLHTKRSGNPTAQANPKDFALQYSVASPKPGRSSPSSKRRRVNLNQDPGDIVAPQTKRAPRSRYSLPSGSDNNTASTSTIPSPSPKSQAKNKKPTTRKIQVFETEPMVVDAKEDIGELLYHRPRAASPSSPDPLNCISVDDTPYEAPHPFDDEPVAGPSSRPTSRSGRGVPSDGPSTSRLQAKIAERAKPEVVNIDDDDDPIENDDPQPSLDERRSSNATRVVPAGNTKRKAELFEKASVVPEIDLRDPIKRAASRKSMMKSQRQALLMKPASHEEHLGSSSSSKPPSGTKSGRAVMRPSSKVFELPLEAWSLGCVLHHPPQGAAVDYFTFSYDTSTHTMTVLSGQGKGNTTRDIVRHLPVQDMSHLTYEKDAKNPIIQLKTTASEKLKSLAVDGFTPGSKHASGLLTFKFKSTAGGWKTTHYQSIITAIRSQLTDERPEILLPPAAKALWSSVTNTYSLWRQTRRRNPPMTTTVESVDSLRSAMSSRRQSASRLGTDSSTNTIVASASGPPKPRPAYKGRIGSVEPEPELSRPPSRRSTRSSLSNRPESPQGDGDELILVYPPTGTGAVNITMSDLWRLRPGEFLNDTLIEFGLKLWLNELRGADPELADQVHVFSSFFYKKLNTRNREEGYRSVRKWTSRFDLFKKKYLIVPINENLHWHLAIIYEPEHVLLPPSEPSKMNTRSQIVDQEPPAVNRQTSPSNTMMSDNASGMSSTTQREENAVEEQLFDYQGSHSGSELVDARPESPATVNGTEATGNGAAVPIYAREDEAPSLRSSSLTPVASDVEMEESLKDQGHAGQGSLPVDAGDAPRKSGVPPSKFYSSSSKKGKRKSDPVPFPMDIDHPPGEQGNDLASALEGRGSIDDGRPSTYIFTLDSLNTGHKQVINVLARYLHMEAKDKKDLEETSPAIGLQAHVPLQPNYCDCGLYLLHFAKTFMKDPDRAARLIRSKKKGTDLERRTDWEAKDIGDFRDELSARIHSLSDEWKKERAAKEEERKKLAAEDSAQANTAANDSDDDIIVEDVRPAKPRTPRGVKRKDRGEDTPAERLR